MKLGVVMEGGASRTVFSCGVTDCFLEEGIMPDYFVGVSAGIAYGVSYLSGQIGRNREIFEKYMPDKRYMGLKYLFDRHMKSYYNIPFVFGEVPNKLVPFDFDAFRAYQGEAEAVVTNIRTGKAEYLPVDRNDTDFKTIVASCALPVLFQPVKIGKRYYLDGGVADSVPYRHALEKGCDKLIVILTRERNYIKTMKELYQAEKEGKVFIIAPKSTLRVGRTESSPKKLLELYDEGYYQAKESMHALDLYLNDYK